MLNIIFTIEWVDFILFLHISAPCTILFEGQRPPLHAHSPLNDTHPHSRHVFTFCTLPFYAISDSMHVLRLAPCTYLQHACPPGFCLKYLGQHARIRHISIHMTYFLFEISRSACTNTSHIDSWPSSCQRWLRHVRRIAHAARMSRDGHVGHCQQTTVHQSEPREWLVLHVSRTNSLYDHTWSEAHQLQAWLKIRALYC